MLSPPPHEHHTLHAGHDPCVQVRRALVHERLGVVGTVRRALLQRVVQAQALVRRLEVLLEDDFLVQRFLDGDLLEVLVVAVVVRVVARAPLYLDLAEIVLEVLDVAPHLAGPVLVSLEAVSVVIIVVVVVVVTAVVGGVVIAPPVDVHLLGGLGTVERVQDMLVGGRERYARPTAAAAAAAAGAEQEHGRGRRGRRDEGGADAGQHGDSQDEGSGHDGRRCSTRHC